MRYFNPHSKAMIFKFIRRVYLLYVVILPVFLQMNCLSNPSSSKETDKPRDRDTREDNRENKEKELHKIYSEKYNAGKKELVSTKNKITQLAGNSPNVTASNKGELTKICKEFMQQQYIPYLKARQNYLAHIKKYETDSTKKYEYNNVVEHIQIYLPYLEALCQGNNTEELCKLILNIEVKQN
jgi:hypothetical protein